MNIQENVSLKLYSTMRLGGTARYVCSITSEEDLLEALEFATKNNIPHRIIGSGSNIIWSDEGFDGLVIVNNIISVTFDDDVTVTFGSGHSWDEAVRITTDKNLSGLEALSLIPGTVGGTPVQNVGAYGQEIANVITELRAYDTQKKEFVNISGSDCQFGYRTSRFKTTDAGRFIITSVTFKLSQQAPTPPFYESLQAYLDKNSITEYTPTTLRNAVIAIRSSKLPDPSQTANNGSFFANPIVPKKQYDNLIAKYPDIKSWELPDGSYKLAAGWLIEKAGFSGIHDAETGMATWPGQNLVIVNENATSTHQLITFKKKIVDKVKELFDVTLEQEPELLP
jgi:UDP-N-acetylmuramate dehydrogenase